MTQTEIAKRAELGVLDSFIRAYRQGTGAVLDVVSASDAPDFVVTSSTGAVAGVEVTTVYYDAAAATSLWQSIRGDAAACAGQFVNPSEQLASAIDRACAEKWLKDYGKRCILLIHADAPLTDAADFERDVIPRLALPDGPAPFSEVYLRAKVGDVEGIELIWWELYPRRRRFAALEPQQ